MLWLLVPFAIIATTFLLIIRNYRYWPNRGVVLGKVDDTWGYFLGRIAGAEVHQMLYNSGKNSRYCGMHQFIQPALILRDPDLIKQITVKDFDHFVDHRPMVPEDDVLFAKNLFSLSGQNWRDTRSIVSPTFTSSKMKFMFSLISQCGEQFANYFLKQNKEVITIEMKDTFTRLTNDVVATVAFGIECDSFEAPKNEFYLMGREVTNFGEFWKKITLYAYMIVPSVAKLLKLKMFYEDSNTSIFFNKLVEENIRSREKHGIVRPDVIHLLMQARKHGIKYEDTENVQDTGFATVQESEIGKKKETVKVEISNRDITCTALMFILGGSDAVSSVMSFMSYELAVHPEIQEKLRREVDETMENCNGKLTYEALMNMKYMDMVMSEALRKWPNAPIIDRMCTKPYTIEPQRPDEKPIHLRKGDLVILPIYAIQRDPEYFPDPDRFDPERFSNENKKNIKPYTYIPFGSGPRNCIGSRFALLQTKALFFYILWHFEIVPVEKTQIPLKLSKKSFVMTGENGIWLGFKRRVK